MFNVKEKVFIKKEKLHKISFSKLSVKESKIKYNLKCY